MWLAAASSSACSSPVRFRARLMYDGLAYTGLQVQSNGRASVAGVLQDVLATRLRQRVRVIAAGRTDAGVHARGQALHFDVDGCSFSDEPAALQHALNCMLPADVRITGLEEAPECDADGHGWHAIYWATGKLYSYRFFSGGVMDPTQRLYRHQERRPLCLERMQRAAELLEGEHDFASFANVRKNDAGLYTTTRKVRSLTIHDEGDGYARADVHLKGALYKQVRNMMGLLFEVGNGRREVAEVPELLARCSRLGLPKPAPACGLTLESVYYNVGWDGRYAHPLHTDTVGLGGAAGAAAKG